MGPFKALVIVWGIFLMITSPAEANQAPDFLLKVETRGELLEVTATPPAHHHINVQAPLKLTTGLDAKPTLKPSTVARDHAVFSVASPHPKEFKVSLYLCDDTNTFCENHTLQVVWDKSTHTFTAKNIHAESKADKSEPPRSKLEHGFIVNDSARAFAEAKRDGKPLLIDFYGIWCPPCNELDERVFSRPSFQKSAARFVTLKLDADSEASWELKSRYKIGGYPTLIFATPEGDEISRVVGFRELDLFVKSMDEAYGSRQHAFAVLKNQADQGDLKASEKVGLTYLERGEHELAANYLKSSALHREEYLDAEIGLWDKKQAAPEKEAATKLTEALLLSIKEFPNSPEAVGRREKLASLYESAKELEKSKTIRKQLIEQAKGLIQHPLALKNHDVTAGDLWESIGEAYENLGETEAAKTAWQEGAQEFKKRASSPRERGANLELAYCLWKAGNLPDAEKIYGILERAFPAEFTFYYAHANALFQNKQYASAQPLAKQAFDFSYGDNRLRAAKLLASILKENGERAQAKSIIEQTLSSTPLPKDPTIRTHRYVQMLRDYAAKLN